LAILASFGMLLWGQWRCLMYAPERCGAKWIMVGSIVCTLVSPTLSIGLAVLGAGGGGGDKVAWAEDEKLTARDAFVNTARDYRDDVRSGQFIGYAKGAASFTSLLGGVLFLLFLRAVTRCSDQPTYTRLIDGYFVFCVALAVGSVYLVVERPFLLREPIYALGLLAGCLLVFVWYLLLLVSTSTCIMLHLARRPSPLALDAPVQGGVSSGS